MAFNVVLMNNTDELNKINKNPATVETVNGVLRDECDIVDPIIEIQYAGTLSNVNYARVEELHRYYFIKKIESVRNGLWRIYCHCDVLKTYAEGILALEAVVSRSETRYNLLINDPMFKVYSNPRLQIAKFSGSFNGDNSYVLIMNGTQTAPT